MKNNRIKRMNVGPQVPFSEELHSQKYRSKGENFREAMNRVASPLTDNEDHFHAFRDALLDMRFMPAGRIQAAIGSTRRITPYNCYVSGTIEDTLVDGDGSILKRFEQAMRTMRMGGGIGYDFSTLRPKGAVIKKLQSRSSGPVSFMDIYNAGCKCIASAGHRRGAQMGILRVDHPDIMEFIHAKNNETELTGFNISIAVTDEFMVAVKEDKPFQLRWGGENYAEVDARNLWNMIMRSTWDWAEPGVLFIDRINDQNNLQYCETIAATNPCGEQPLPPFGACLLGSFNLVKYLTVGDAGYFFDFDKLKADIPVVVRAMDNVVDEAIYPMFEQEKEAKSKRRMGLGVTGVANCIETLGHLYGSKGFLDTFNDIMHILANECYRASSKLAQEKGSFPLYDRDKYCASPFIQGLDKDVEDEIRRHGIRNSHLISIAPTGTISLCADNISSGIEPVFAYSFDRTVIEFKAPRVETVEDYGLRVFGTKGKVSKDVTPQEHLDVVTVAYRWVDSAVSKTCNVPADCPWTEFKDLYMKAWEARCKGITTFQPDGKRKGVLTVTEKEEENVPAAENEEAACRVDPVTGRHECE